MSPKTGPVTKGLQRLAIPAALSLILFLPLSAQWLFSHTTFLDPGPLSTTESVVLNTLLACILWTYWRACTVDPGRYVFDDDATLGVVQQRVEQQHLPLRWCKKCDAPKPPRSHHCRHCGRCVPKMDHHCPWTGNCVSLQTFPHFLRFIVWTNVALWYFLFLVTLRFVSLWEQRHLPYYLGPSLGQLVHLTVLLLLGSGTTLALMVMLWNTLTAWLFNMTMIESWEADRHEAVLARTNHTSADGTWWDEGGNDDDDDDDDERSEEEEEEDSESESEEESATSKKRSERSEEKRSERNEEKKSERSEEKKTKKPMKRIEFPYDIGLFSNMAQAMGTNNVLLWLFPLAGGPHVGADGVGPGWEYPENGFNDRIGMWPPVDPDKERHAAALRKQGLTGREDPDQGFTTGVEAATRSPQEEKDAFRLRQQADFIRRRIVRIPTDDEDPFYDLDEGMDGKPGWTNADGDRLGDYGVDEEEEDEEEDEDDEVPLSELLRRRKNA